MKDKISISEEVLEKRKKEIEYEKRRSDGAMKINDLIDKYFGINLVTCGQCGEILSHETNPQNELDFILKCHCGYKNDLNGFPDLFY